MMNDLFDNSYSQIILVQELMIRVILSIVGILLFLAGAVLFYANDRGGIVFMLLGVFALGIVTGITVLEGSPIDRKSGKFKLKVY